MSTGVGGVGASVELDDAQIQAAVARLRSSIESIGVEMRRLQADFAAGNVTIDQYIDNVQDLQSAMARAESGVRSFEVGMGGASGKTQAGVRALVDFSRAAEDFSTGGFLGVMNNLPGIFTNVGQAIGASATAIGLFVGGASILAAIGYTVYRNWDSIVSMFGDRNPFPEAADSVERFTNSINKNKKELDDLREKQSLSNDELAKANRLIAENIDLEKRREDQRNLDRFKGSEDPKAKAEAQALENASKGMGKQVASSLAETFREETDRENLKRNIQVGQIYKRASELEGMGLPEAASEYAIGAGSNLPVVKSPQEKADDLIKRILRNEPGAFDEFRKRMSSNPEAFAPEFLGRMQSEDPSRKIAYDTDANMAKLGEEAKKRIEEQELERYDTEAADFQREIDARREAINKRKEREKLLRKAEQRNERRQQEAVESAVEIIPGIADITERAFLESRVEGSSPLEASDQIRALLADRLVKAGMGQEDASRAAKGLAIQAGKKVAEATARKRLDMLDNTGRGEGDRQKIESSQVFSGADITSRIQAGVNNEHLQHNHKMESLTEQMLNALANRIPLEIQKIKSPRLRVGR